MAGDKYRLPGPLQLDAGVARRRAAKLVMNRHGLRLIHDRRAARPETRAVIGILVVRRPVSFVEATEPFECGSAGQEKGTRAEIDLPLEIVFGSRRIAAASIGLARSVRPDDGPGLLKTAVGKHELSAHGAD